MELNHLRYFYEVARQGSFTKAARTLRISQPSISKTIKLLESHYDLKLFDRGKRRVDLTEMGRRFYESTRLIFDELEGLEGFVRTSRAECAGDLPVGASDNLCNYVLPSLFTSFCALHPKVTPRLFSGTSEEIKSGLVSGRLELGLFYTQVQDAGYVVERLAQVDFAIVVPGAMRRVSLSELKELTYVGSQAADYARPYPALAMLHSLGVKPRAFFETNNQETQKRLVAGGLGYTIVPRHMVRDELKRGLLRQVPTPRPVGAPLLLCRRKGKHLSRAAAAFEEHLKKSVAKALSP